MSICVPYTFSCFTTVLESRHLMNHIIYSPGAEIRSVCTEAGMFAIRARRKVASEKDFLEAVNKVIKSYAKFSATPRYMTYNWGVYPTTIVWLGVLQLRCLPYNYCEGGCPTIEVFTLQLRSLISKWRCNLWCMFCDWPRMFPTSKVFAECVWVSCKWVFFFYHTTVFILSITVTEVFDLVTVLSPPRYPLFNWGLWPTR